MKLGLNEAKLVSVIFATDPRVIAHIREQYDLGGKSIEGQQELLENGTRIAFERGEKGSDPEAVWLEDARQLAKRVGSRWQDLVTDTPEELEEKADLAWYKRQSEAMDRELTERERELTSVPREYRRGRDAWFRQEDARREAKVAQALASNAAYGKFASKLPPPVKAMRKWTMGVEMKVRLPPFADTRISVSPYIAFRGTRLVLPAHVASKIRIMSIQIGNAVQFAGGDGIPGDVFSPDAFPLPLHLDTCRVGQYIIFQLQALPEAVDPFAAVLSGYGEPPV